MARFNFEQYDGSIPDNEVVFSTGNQYANPSGETETRKQLSTPLYQLKTFINSLFDSNDKIIPTNIPVATTSNSGTMSASDKAKLNGIESGAEVNTIETVKVNGTALTPSDKAVDIPNGTTSASGLMSSADKTKLDGIDNGAQVNVIEAITLGGSSTIPLNKTVNIPVATIMNRGLMSAGDKSKLNSLPDFINTELLYLNDPASCANIQSVGIGIGNTYLLYVDEDGNHDPIFTLVEIPTPTRFDAGKVLGVDADGNWALLKHTGNIIVNPGDGEIE